VKFQVLTAVSMKMVIFWVIAPCSLEEVHRRFRGVCHLHHQGSSSIIAPMIEAARTSETSVNFYHTIRRNNSDRNAVFRDLSMHCERVGLFYFKIKQEHKTFVLEKCFLLKEIFSNWNKHIYLFSFFFP
jgi:hypothetical protein